jgi:hypothetical protein
MKGTSRGSIALLLAILLCFALQTGFSQAVYGNISGTVSDTSGARVPGATVTVTDVNKGTKETTTTNATGAFLVTHLIPGTYRVRVEAPNFKAFEAKEVRVFADQTADLNPALAAGGSTETVEVTAEDVPVIKTDRADVATLFTERQVEDLPVINRNFTNFQLLTPGTQQLGWQHAASENPQSSTQIFVNGQHFSGTSFQLDGTDNRDPILGIIVVNPNLDAVTEAKIATQNYDAEFGQAIAAVVTAQTKSGGNSFHGSGFWLRRNDELQARNPFTQSTKNPLTGKFIPDSLRNQFGGSIGGPVIKNKWFFFGDYQGTREKTGSTRLTTVPSALIRSSCLAAGSAGCNFSEYLASGIQLYDPATGSAGGIGRTPFAGNIIPINRLSPGAVNLLSLLPAPNRPGIRDNYVGSGTGGLDSDGYDVRSDYNATSKLHVFGRYSYQRFNLGGPAIFDTPDVAVGGLGLGINGFAGQSKTHNHSLATGFDYSLNNNWLTDFRFGWFKYHVQVNPNGVGKKYADDLGIPGLNTIPGIDEGDFTTGMPAFFIDGGSTTGDTAIGYALGDRLTRCNCPLDENEDQFQFVNNWTNIRGNHQIKFGADIRYARNLRVPSDQHRAGELYIKNEGTGLAGTTSGAALASLLLGDVYQIKRYFSTSTDAGERQKRWYFYGQDTWRATPKLTINYGVRWEIYFPQTVTGKDKGGFLDLNTGRIRVAGENGFGSDMSVDNNFRNFAPRLGIAYQFTPKTVLRMGYGRSFDIGVFGSTFGHSVTQNLPVLGSQQLTGASNFDAAFQLSSGPAAPSFPAIESDGQITLPDGIFQRIMPNRLRMPTVDAWNVTVQHQFTNTLSGEIAYVGNKGTHVFAGNGPAYNLNQATVAGFTPGRNNNAAKLLFHRYPFQVIDPVTGACPFCWTQGIDYLANDASNNYHGLQTKIEKRFANGVQFLAHYTWAQAFNYDADYYPIDPKVSHAPNDLNRRHVFVFTSLMELPYGRGKKYGANINRAMDAILGGWQLNTILNISSGLPFSPSYKDCGNDRDTGPCRPNDVGHFHVGNTSLDANNHFVQYFFPVPEMTANGQVSGPWSRPGVGTFGTAGRNSLRGPGFWNADMSIFKRFTVTEKVNAQFRMNAYNVFNHRNNDNPGNTCIDCENTNAGQITGLAPGSDMRKLEFGIRVDF